MLLMINSLASVILMGAGGLVLIHISPWRQGRTPICWVRVALAVSGACGVIIGTGTALWQSLLNQISVFDLLLSMTSFRVGAVMLLGSGILRFKRELL